MQLLDVERVGDAEHHRHVGLRPRRQPFGVEVVACLGLHRIDADHLLSCGLQRFEPRVGAVVGDQVADLVVVDRVGAPEHHQLGVLGHHRPSGRLLVDLDRADDVGQDHLGRAGRVVARRVHEAAVLRKHAAQQALAVVQLARTLPAVRAGEDRRRAVLGANPLQFPGDEIQRLGPRDAHEVAVATAIGIGARAVLEICPPHHRVLDAGRRIDRIENAGQLIRRPGVVLPWPDGDDAAVVDAGPEGAPVASGQYLAARRVCGVRSVAQQRGAAEAEQAGASAP